MLVIPGITEMLANVPLKLKRPANVIQHVSFKVLFVGNVLTWHLTILFTSFTFYLNEYILFFMQVFESIITIL